MTDPAFKHLLEELILQVQRLAYAVELSVDKSNRTFDACRRCGSTLVVGKFPCGSCGTVPRNKDDDSTGEPA